RLGKAHLRAEWLTPGAPVLLEAELRRYLPYFELSTIWGFFSPVAYHEAALRGSWAPSPAASVWLRGAWRRYGDADATTVLRPLEDDGWRAAAGGSWRAGPRVALEARYALDWGAGASLSAADAAARWTVRPSL